jgi:hypothetical protein
MLVISSEARNLDVHSCKISPHFVRRNDRDFVYACQTETLFMLVISSEARNLDVHSCKISPHFVRRNDRDFV